MPLTSRIHELFVAVRDSHGETLDHSANILQIEKLMPLPQQPDSMAGHLPYPDT